ncbi:MAG: Stp1/IreP family PP2C-type Ser/Thr phosphatase [Candidatus Doudnabacteria bacterium]
MNPRLKQTWAALSDIGRVRTHNEDSILAQPPLFVVADGLGGHEAGEVASSMAVETLRDYAPRKPDAKALARAVRAANREVLRAAREGLGKQGMGTTMTAAIVEGTRIAIAQVGDSRAYLLHAGVLERVTEDHSMVADMIRMGQLTEAESRYHPNRSVITRALGTDPNMTADPYEFDAEPGDRLLLCSDGLTSMLEDAAIAEMLTGYRDPAVAARALVDASNDAGGHDNISVIIVDIEGEGPLVGATVDASGTRAGRGMLAFIGWLLLFVVVVGGIGYGTWRYAWTRAYVTSSAAPPAGTPATSSAFPPAVVVVYRGVPGAVAGIRLNQLVEETTIPVSALPPGAQAKIARTVRLSNLADAEELVAKYRALAEASSPASGTAPDTGAPGVSPDASATGQ